MKTPANENGASNGSARERLAQSEKFSRILLEVTNKLAVAKNLDDALAVLVGITTSHIHAERGTVFINDQTTESYIRGLRRETLNEKFAF